MAQMTFDVIKKILGTHDIDTLVETGTADGKSTAIFAEVFKHVISIELSPELFKLSTENLNGIENILLIRGDSSEEIPRIAKNLDRPVLFYLDAHYCVTARYNGHAAKYHFPLWRELDALKKRKYPDIIVIDDVHSFGMKRPDGYEDWEFVTPESIIAYMNDEKGFPMVKSGTVINDQFVMYMYPR